ncbi:MAG: elongation factor Ts [Patescibacteria group bacterium]
MDIAKVQKLRETTMASINDVKKALDEANDNEQEALLILRKRGKVIADKRGGRATSAGVIASYVHQNGTIGVLVEVRCETDFVAKTEEFRRLARDLALHVTAARPLWVRPEDVPEDVVRQERSLYEAQVTELKKPQQVAQQIVEGKLAQYYDDTCLLRQRFVKDEEKSVADVITESIAKVGENIEVGRFARFEI